MKNVDRLYIIKCRYLRIYKGYRYRKDVYDLNVNKIANIVNIQKEIIWGEYEEI